MRENKLVSFLLRLITLPFIFAIIFISYNFHAINNSILFLRFGGEWISYTNKHTKKTIADTFRKLVEQQEKNKVRL